MALSGNMNMSVVIKTNGEKMARMDIPDRMRSTTFVLPIDDRKVAVICNWVPMENGARTIALWIKIKPTDSYIDRELRASGKLVSRLLQYGADLKDIAETVTTDNIVGHVVNYYHKNMEDILAGAELEKDLNMMTTDPLRFKI